MMSYRFIVLLLLGLISSTSHVGAQTIASDPIASPLVESLTKIADSGGRLDWYHGRAHELIVYDAPNGRATEVYTMQPDGSQKTCITCDMDRLPKGFRGQPAWHPDGKHIVIQAESEHSNGSLYNHMAWGINADLWLIDKSGARADRIFRSALNHGALHAHFDKTGRRIVFSERIATGKVIVPLMKRLGAGGENQWDGWHIHLANVDPTKTGESVLSNHKKLFTSQKGFYETHGFGPQGQLVFSYTKGGKPFVDDIYEAPATGGRWKTLIQSPRTWDEHAQFSPSGKTMAFISSRADKNWRAPLSRARTLRSELFVRGSDGVVHQLTRFNVDGGTQYMVSDFSWDRSGKRIALQVAPVKMALKPPPPQIWMLQFKLTH